jgi:hypothetical protein
MTYREAVSLGLKNCQTATGNCHTQAILYIRYEEKFR